MITKFNVTVFCFICLTLTPLSLYAADEIPEDLEAKIKAFEKVEGIATTRIQLLYEELNIKKIELKLFQDDNYEKTLILQKIQQINEDLILEYNKLANNIKRVEEGPRDNSKTANAPARDPMVKQSIFEHFQKSK